ncbi:phosphoserine phosphatase [Mycoavidus cysteinexigens]|uniref:Phosphoserine phosphatase n=1 Tax=Mycoavidus cysteinexigens TaxID=1553431 RepID=A0A2Z6EVW4_9BURK|nr:phosphoserine phosphatase SerB [Mycoavidus cysteinexigens]BBE09561.1 phosphoserine phosphatase [Mycoavidus cysteinexigens]GAM51675.1 phosphoserine phosphatase [bacterium endosymbiont of Mortierella elongata FMR23-6]GLR01057.1 phosphoserine phosphatase SerB [Mycoavidus cysteinexigens]
MNLILQSTQLLSSAQLEQARVVAGGVAALRLDDYAARILNVDLALRAQVTAWCAQHQLDCAYMPPRSLAEFSLVVMDMDSTLITIECIDEIADFCGLKSKVMALTEASMRGEIIDFEESLRRRVALLKGLNANVLEQVWRKRLKLSLGAQRMLAGVQAAGLHTLLVSGGFTFFTERLAARLRLDYAYANRLGIHHGKLTGEVVGEIVDAQAKKRRLYEVCAELGITASRAIVIGDGANDLLMMAPAGLSVAFRAKPVVRQAADVSLEYIGLDGILRLFG